jgi:hypothetical protein
MKTTKLLSLLFAFVLLFNISCSSSNDDVKPLTYENGFFVVNEGNMSDKDAEVTFVSRDLSVKQDKIYSTNNPGEVLSILQKVATNGDKAYLVVNDFNKIVVVNRTTFKKVAEITNQINSPRDIAFANGNIYVTNDNFTNQRSVTVYKISDLSFVTKIPLTDPTEKIVEAGGNIFVQNASYGYGNKITPINTSTNTALNAITFPNGDVTKTISNGGNVYALAATATNSYIYKLSNTGNITSTTTLTGIPNASNLQMENGKFYFTSANKIYSMDANSTTVPANPIITAVDGGPYFTLYGFSVLDGKIFTSDVKGFTQASEVTVYSTSNSSKISTFTAGKGTNGVVASY